MDSDFKKGIIMGIVIPIIIGAIVKVVFYDYISLDNLMNFPQLLSPFIQWGIVGNLIIFFIFMQMNRQRVQQGIVLPTLLYALFAVVTKMFL